MRAIGRHVRNLSSVMGKFIVVAGASKGIGGTRLGNLGASRVNVTVICWSPGVLVSRASNVSCLAGRATLARRHSQDEAVCSGKQRSAPRLRDHACISALRQNVFSRRSVHTVPVPRSHPRRTGCSIRRRQHYRQDSRTCENSFPLSRWAETLRPDPIPTVACSDKELSSAFNE
jgi:hypothetical protein